MSVLRNNAQPLVRYRVELQSGPFAFCVRDERGQAVDLYRTRSAAEYAVRLLNDGAAILPHAVIGCRVTGRL